MSHIKVSQSCLGEKMMGIKGIDFLSHYVYDKFAIAANMLILLKNLDDSIRFPQIFADMAMGGSPRYIFSVVTCTFHL